MGLYRVALQLDELRVHLERVRSMPDVAKRIIDTEIERLARMMHAKVAELATSRLASRRNFFLSQVSFVEDGVSGSGFKQYKIVLSEEALWVEKGIAPNTNMIDWLLNRKSGGPVRFAKDGSRYRIIPFKQNKLPQNTPNSQMELRKTVQNEFRRLGLPGFGTLETGAGGAPIIGKVRRLNILDKPLKTAEGPGQGKGRIGQVRQGPTGIPFLQGLTVYQRPDASGSVKKDVMTFRIVSEKHKSQPGRWVHPGLAPTNIFKDTAEWGQESLKDEIMPAVIRQLQSIILGG
jgi:hypothetical protein